MNWITWKKKKFLGSYRQLVYKQGKELEVKGYVSIIENVGIPTQK